MSINTYISIFIYRYIHIFIHTYIHIQYSGQISAFSLITCVSVGKIEKNENRNRFNALKWKNLPNLSRFTAITSSPTRQNANKRKAISRLTLVIIVYFPLLSIRKKRFLNFLDLLVKFPSVLSRAPKHAIDLNRVPPILPYSRYNIFEAAFIVQTFM